MRVRCNVRAYFRTLSTNLFRVQDEVTADHYTCDFDFPPLKSFLMLKAHKEPK